MKKTNLITEFMKKNNMVDKTWNSFLVEYESNESTVKELSEKYNLNYNSLRYLFYSLGFVNNSKAKRMESVLELQKDLAREAGAEYNIVEELEKELDLVVNKNRALVRTVNITRDENNHLRKIARREDRVDTFEEKILEEFSQKLTSLEINKFEFNYKALPEPILEKGTVLLLGDAHFGDESKDEICGNNFNHNIATQRLNCVIDTLLNYPNQSEILTVFELLDMTKGLIHFSEYLSEEGITGTMLKVVEVYADVYEKLSPAYKKVEVFVTNSNHDRTTQKPTYRDKWDNFGIMLMKMVEMVLKAKKINNIEFNYTKNEYHLLEINGSNILGFHGDSVRRYSPSSKSERTNLQSICYGIFKDNYNIAVSGHTHQSAMVSNEFGGYNIVNGSLGGNSEYGITNGYSSIEPCQTIMFINDKGKVQDLHFINLSHIQ